MWLKLNYVYGLQKLMNGLNRAAEEYGMRINVKKTKAMVISRIEGKKVGIKIGQHKVEQVQKFKYLGAIVTKDGRCEEEIKCRIAITKHSFEKKEESFVQ